MSDGSNHNDICPSRSGNDLAGIISVVLKELLIIGVYLLARVLNALGLSPITLSVNTLRFATECSTGIEMAVKIVLEKLSKLIMGACLAPFVLILACVISIVSLFNSIHENFMTIFSYIFSDDVDPY